MTRTERDENTKGATLDNTFVGTIFAHEMLCPRANSVWTDLGIFVVDSNRNFDITLTPSLV
jgi:hypothetical protein